jgi:hypothetical protein
MVLQPPADLRARSRSGLLQGKSCFNFKSVKPALFKELAGLTKAGYASDEQQGFAP